MGRMKGIIAIGPGDLLKVWMRPKVRQKGFSSNGRVSKIRNQPV